MYRCHRAPLYAARSPATIPCEIRLVGRPRGCSCVCVRDDWFAATRLAPVRHLAHRWSYPVYDIRLRSLEAAARNTNGMSVADVLPRAVSRSPATLTVA